MNSNNSNASLKSRPKKKGFKGTPKSNKKNEMFKQTVEKTNDKTQFSLLKKLFHSGQHESAKFPIGFENQGNNVSNLFSD